MGACSPAGARRARVPLMALRGLFGPRWAGSTSPPRPSALVRVRSLGDARRESLGKLPERHPSRARQPRRQEPLALRPVARRRGGRRTIEQVPERTLNLPLPAPAGFGPRAARGTPRGQHTRSPRPTRHPAGAVKSPECRRRLHGGRSHRHPPDRLMLGRLIRRAFCTARGRSPRMRQSSRQFGTRRVRAPRAAIRRAGVGAVRRQRRPDADVARHSPLRSAAPDGADPVEGHRDIIHGERPQQLNDYQDTRGQRRTLSASRPLEAPTGKRVTSVLPRSAHPSTPGRARHRLAVVFMLVIRKMAQFVHGRFRMPTYAVTHRLRADTDLLL